MPKHSRYLHLRLQMERDKLVDWAVLANLSEDERTLNSGLHLNQHKVNGALQETRLVLLDLIELSGWHDLDQPSIFIANRSLHGSPKASSLRLNSSLQREAVAFAERTRRFPLQIKWAIFDKKKFELLLAKLTALNQNMMYFFEQRQQEIHSQMQESSVMGVLQSNNKLDDLLDVMASLNATSLYRRLPAHEQRLLRLVRFKAFRIAIIEAGNSFDEGKIRDDLGDPPTHLDRVLLDDRRYIAGEEDDLLEYEPSRTWGTYGTVPVWIEWRYCRYHPDQLLRHERSYCFSIKLTWDVR